VVLDLGQIEMENEIDTADRSEESGFELSRRLWRLVLAAIDLYGGVLVLYLLLRAAFGNSLGPVALLNAVLPWVLLPAFLLLPVTLALRRWIPAGMVSMGVVLFVWLYGGLFLPPLDHPNGSEMLTVMTYNVADGLASPDNLVAAIRGADADIVALEELGEEQAMVITQDLRDLYPYQALYGCGIPGKGLLSRYPIVDQELFYLQAERLPYLRAVIAVDELGEPGEIVELTVIVVHPPPPGIGPRGYTQHPFAAPEIASVTRMAREGEPSIVMGDFNLVDQDDNYRLLKEAGLRDAFRVAGWGLGATWPAGGVGPLWPVVRVDYVWYTPQFHATRALVGPDAGSDHLPVLAELAWVGSGD
jgi:vancomycin resistance protein VanJ